MLPLKIRNNPFHRIGDRYGRVFDNNHFLGRSAFDDNWMTKAITNITRSDEGYHIKVLVPGFDKDEIDVSLVNHTLKVLADKKTPSKEEMLHEEISPCRVERSFELAYELDIDKIEAKLEKGVLTIFVPLETEDKHTTKIEIH